MSELEYAEIEYIMDDLYEARKLWERKEYLITPRVMGSVALGGSGIDDALDAFNAYRAFEEEYGR